MSKQPTAATPGGSLTRDAGPLAAVESHTPAAFRASIQLLERALLATPGVVTELPLEHFFASGVYVRQLSIPANTVLTGKIHRRDCINIVLGDIEVATEEGRRRLTGFNVFRGPAGVKRAGHTFSDTIWLTVHANPTNECDGDKMADRLTVPTFEAFEALANLPNL